MSPQRSNSPSPRDPARILVRGVNWLGDAVMATPALRRLRERFPSAHITLLTRRKLADLWTLHPDLDAVLAVDDHAGAWTVSRAARDVQADLALILPNSPRSALECWLARIPARVGLARRGRNWMLTRPVPARLDHVDMRQRSKRQIRALTHSQAGQELFPVAAHHVFDYLHLAAALGASREPVPPKLCVSAEEVDHALAKFGLTTSTPSPPLVFGVNPGAEYGPAKRWPLESFLAAASAIRDRTACVWWILGGKGDTPLAQALERRLLAGSHPASIVNLAGRTSLRELCALLRACRGLLTNDTGPMHVAAALGTPVVAPFGSTSPELTGPGMPGEFRHRIIRGQAPCAPCFRRVCPIDFRCLRGINPGEVAQVFLEAVSKPR